MQMIAGNFTRSSARNSPLFAFVGVAFATNQNWNKERSFSDTVCEDIRNIFHVDHDKEGVDCDASQGLCLENLEFGQLIDKGCNAAVYEAKWKHTGPTIEDDIEILDAEISSTSFFDNSGIETVSPLLNVVIPADDVDSDVDSTCPSEFDVSDSDISIISEDEVELRSETACNLELEEPLLRLLQCEIDGLHQDVPDHELITDAPARFDLAVKMMFNYDADSNTECIQRAMMRETLPVRVAASHQQMEQWQNGSHVRKKEQCGHLPPHPNIVDMHGTFVSSVLFLPQAMEQYPDALPHRINPDGVGRDRTMYLVMKKYNMTLREFLSRDSSISTHISTILLTQLVEGVVHLVQSGIAHRDLKADNILMDNFDDDTSIPGLVISDFGCCLSDVPSLKLPFVSEDTCRGGNGALMAPEIASTEPGPNSFLDFSQSDLWAVGAMAYELFGEHNPFYRDERGQRLSSRHYTEDMLPVMQDVPCHVSKLIKLMLKRDPVQRPIPEVIADALHLCLWAPTDWITSETLPNQDDVLHWLVTFAAQVLLWDDWLRITKAPLERECSDHKTCDRHGWSETEHELRKTFLRRVDMDEILEAIDILRG